MIKVADDGPGVPDDVFQALQSGGRVMSTRAGGNGLGLLSVQTLLRRAGGNITSPERIRYLVAHVGATRDRGRCLGGHVIHLSRVRILVADDQVDVARTLCSALRRHGALLTFVADAEQAYTRVDAEPYDLLIVDMKMPPGEWGSLWHTQGTSQP